MPQNPSAVLSAGNLKNIIQMLDATALQQVEALIRASETNIINSLTKIICPEPDDAREYFTERELVQRFDISRGTIRNWEIKGILQPVMLGRSKRYPAVEIYALEKTNRLTKRATPKK